MTSWEEKNQRLNMFRERHTDIFYYFSPGKDIINHNKLKVFIYLLIKNMLCYYNCQINSSK